VPAIGRIVTVPSRARTDLIASTDNEVAGLAGLAVGVGSPNDAYRIKELTFDPAAHVPSSAWPHALGRRIRDRVTVTQAIPVSSFALSKQVFIDGISHHIDFDRNWSTTFQFASTSAWAGFSASVWDTGVWDTAAWFY
jgi:hypothetical protein